MDDCWELAAYVRRSPLHNRTWVPQFMNDLHDHTFSENAGPWHTVKAYVEQEMGQSLGPNTRHRWTRQDPDTWDFEVTADTTED